MKPWDEAEVSSSKRPWDEVEASSSRRPWDEAESSGLSEVDRFLGERPSVPAHEEWEALGAQEQVVLAVRGLLWAVRSRAQEADGPTIDEHQWSVLLVEALERLGFPFVRSEGRVLCVYGHEASGKVVEVDGRVVCADHLPISRVIKLATEMSQSARRHPGPFDRVFRSMSR